MPAVVMAGHYSFVYQNEKPSRPTVSSMLINSFTWYCRLGAIDLGQDMQLEGVSS